MAENEFHLDDPHASKIDPDDPRLSMNQTKRTGKRIKKGAVVGVAFVALGLLLLALIIALQPPKMKMFESEENGLEVKNNYVQPPNSIKEAVVNTLTPDQVPVLGPPLPGDLGATMVQPQPKPSANYVPPSDPSPEEQARLKRYQKALMAAPTFSSGGADGSLGGAAGQNSGRSIPDRVNDGFSKSMVGLQEKLIDNMGQLTGGTDSIGLVAAQNMQDEKREFRDHTSATDDNYLSNSLTWPRSKFEVKAGSIIPVSLITGINSDLPGDIIGQVRENVYDTVTGNHLLVPQGSRLMAEYDSIIAYGQERALICWNRLIRPDGSSIDLECSPGVDLEGYAGVSDKVDNHWLRLVGGVVLSSVLAVSATMSQGDIEGQHATVQQKMAASAGESLNNVGQQITEKNLNIQPTITVRPGFSVNVLVNKDMILSPYER